MSDIHVYGIISDACTICDGRGRIGLAVAVLHFITIIILIFNYSPKMPDEIKIQGTTCTPTTRTGRYVQLAVSRYPDID